MIKEQKEITFSFDSLTIQTIIVRNSMQLGELRRSSSYKEHMVNALASRADEGRDKLR